MIFDGVHFVYGNFYSKKYHVIMAHLDTGPLLMSAGQIQTKGFFNKADNSLHVLKNDLSESPLNFEMEIFKDDFSSFATPERREIEKALFNKPRFQKLFVDTTDEDCSESYQHVDGVVRRFYLNCRFMNPERIEKNGGATIGYKFTIESDGGFLIQEPITKTITFADHASTSTALFEVMIDDDTNDFVYPDVTIKMGSSGGSATIRNLSDDESRPTKFTDLPANASVVTKGSIMYVSGNYFQNFYSRKFIRLIDGYNRMFVAGDVASMTFTWNNRRFLW